MIMSIILCKFCCLQTSACCSVVSEDHEYYQRKQLAEGMHFLRKHVLKFKNLVKCPDDYQINGKPKQRNKAAI